MLLVLLVLLVLLIVVILVILLIWWKWVQWGRVNIGSASFPDWLSVADCLAGGGRGLFTFYRISRGKEAAIYSCGLPLRRHRTAFRSPWSVPRSFGLSGRIISEEVSRYVLMALWKTGRALHPSPLRLPRTWPCGPARQMRSCTQGTTTLDPKSVSTKYPSFASSQFSLISFSYPNNLFIQTIFSSKQSFHS